MLAEAGTGVGKTLGYIAPASLWAEKNDGAGLDLHLSPAICSARSPASSTGSIPIRRRRRRRVVIRKGRENYLCLLNYEEAVAGLPMRPYDAAPLGLMARWVAGDARRRHGRRRFSRLARRR